MNRVVYYVMSHDAHLPYLVVSLFWLRKVWDGEVRVYAWPESIEIVREIAVDSNLDIVPIYWEPEYRGKNDQFLCKQKIAQSMAGQASECLYLDADTMPVRKLEFLFEMAEAHSFAMTQFCNWTTKGGVVQNRIKRLLGREEINQKCVNECLSNEWPSVNGGVFCCDPKSLILELWTIWTWHALDIFIADETVLHPLLVKSRMSDQFKACAVHGYNTSPKYRDIDADRVRIWHFHGDSNVRYSKSEEGFKLWWQQFEFCKRAKVGNIMSWLGGINNKYLKQIEGWDG